MDTNAGRAFSLGDILHHNRHPGAKVSKDKTTMDDNASVLMVDQLWLWVLDDGKLFLSQICYSRHQYIGIPSHSACVTTLIRCLETVVTFAPSKEMDDGESEKYLKGDILRLLNQNINGDYAKQCDDCFDFAALAVYFAVKSLLDFTDDPSLQVVLLFEEYISELVS